MKLAEYLRKEAHLSEEEAQLYDNLWNYSALPKGYLLLKEGSNSKKVFYVEQGLMRLYYLKDGKDITNFFFAESTIYTPIENFLKQYYPYRLELLENSIIRTVDFAKVKEHLASNAKLQRLVRYTMTDTIKRLTNRLYSIQFQSAQDRYKILLKKHPDFLLRAPLGHIASYLGITQQTLSVIRAQKFK